MFMAFYTEGGFELRSKNFSIETDGTITATQGTIGGWTLGTIPDQLKLTIPALYYPNSMGFAIPSASTDPVIWAGVLGGATPWNTTNWKKNTPFYVTKNGIVNAIGGVFTDAKIQSLRCGTEKSLTYSSKLVQECSNETPTTTRWFDDGHEGFYYLTFIVQKPDNNFKELISVTGIDIKVGNESMGKGWHLTG
jgi:hypothetical protein